MSTEKEQLEVAHAPMRKEKLCLHSEALAVIAQRDARIAELEAQAGDGTSGNKYRAELYDEVWQAAREMGYGNVTSALQELAALKAQQPSAGVVLPERMTEEEIHAIDMDCTMQIDFALGIEGHVRSEFIRLNPCRAQSVPDGWVMVPAVATDHMTWVGQSMRHDTEISIGSIYCAMLAAAPYAQQKESE